MTPTGGPNGGEAASLVESAMLLRWRAPELALLLADRAVTAAQDDTMAVLRADHIAVFALNRLGRYGEAAHRLLPAIGGNATPQGLGHELQVELAHCAAALGEPAIALRAVYAVLAAGDDVAPVLRGEALVAVAEAAAALSDDSLVTVALEEADELYREDPSLDRDTALLLRAAVRATHASYLRSQGEAAAAEATAREGRELLSGLADPDHDSGEVSARLMLELTLSLLVRGEGETALQEVRPLLRRTVRAAAAASVGRLRLALATQVHLAAGRHEPALTLLADAVEGAQRYGLDAVLADCLEGLSHVHEARDEFADALHCMRAARAAELRHRQDVDSACVILRDHFGTARREEVRLLEEVAELLGNAGTGSGGLDADTGPIPVDIIVEALAHQVAEVEDVQARLGAADVVEPDIVQGSVPPVQVAGTDVAESVAEEKDAVVHTVELPVSTAADISLVAPDVTPGEPGSKKANAVTDESSGRLDSWQSRARHRRGTAGTVLSVSDLLPPSALSAGRSGRRRAEEPVGDRGQQRDTVEASEPADGGPEQNTAAYRHARNGDDASSTPTPANPVPTPIKPVPTPSPASSPPAGSAPAGPASADSVETSQDGASDRSAGQAFAEDTEGLPVIRREFSALGPPPAPTPRALEWETVDDVPAESRESQQMGLGDLLAEALAAYQESREVHADARATGTTRTDGSSAAEDDTSRDLPGYGAGSTRWATGLVLAPNTSPGEANQAEPSEAITNPLLRLPDLTAEPRWAPPERGPRWASPDRGHWSAAGD
jgi:hypothetical protein